MVRVLSAALVLCAASAAAASTPPPLPSFEASAARLQESVAALRAAQLKAKAGELGPRLNAAARDLEGDESEAYRLQNDLRFLMSRVRSGRPDQILRWDVQRFTRELSALARDAQWRLTDLRSLSAQAQKDEALISPASRVLASARSLDNTVHWLVFDARFAYFDLQRAGFTFEAMDLDRGSRDMDGLARELLSESEKLLAKVRG